MWLLHELVPDHNTIANFRKDNPQAIKLVFRKMVVMCKKLDLKRSIRISPLLRKNSTNTLKHFGYDFSVDAHSYSMIVDVPYFYEFYTFDPINVFKTVKCPILSIIGDKDLQVDARINQPSIENALITGGNKNFSIHTPKGYNHLFQKHRQEIRLNMKVKKTQYPQKF
jgi:hypothetical protein